MEIKYKVLVDEGNGRLVSAHVRGSYCLVYSATEWTEAPDDMLVNGYGLCVFSDLDGFDLLLFRTAGFTIYECEVEDQLSLPEKRISPNLLSDAEKGKASFLLDDDNALDTAWPAKTEMYKRVKLTKKVV